MAIQVEFNTKTEAQVKAAAEARELPVEAHAGSLLKSLATEPTSNIPSLSREQFHAMLDALAAGSAGLPDLPTESFSRESFYEDRG